MSSQKSKYERVAPKDSSSDDLEETIQISDVSIEKPETPLKRRFWVRAISCILCPPLFTAYFIWTYIEFLRLGGDDRGANSVSPNGTLLWWSWFIIGALGLNVSNYVLAGVEAGMLMQPRFGALTIDQISLHKDRSWSKISGWFHTFKGAFHRRKEERKYFSRVWLLLSILTVMSWAFVLTGLTMETRDSFKAGKDRGVEILGVNASTFHRSSAYDVLEAAFHNWGQAQEANVPWNGAVYFTPGRKTRFNMTGGNTIPSRTDFHPKRTSNHLNRGPSTTIEPIFLAPQSEFPVTGETWGLLVEYRCDTVTALSDFKILNHRLNSSAPNYINGDEKNGKDESRQMVFWEGDMPSHIFYTVPDLINSDRIRDSGQSPTISFLKDPGGNGNVVMFAEVGMSNGVGVLEYDDRGYGSNYTRGIEDEEIFEVALWQYKPQDGSLEDQPEWMEGIIPELTGEHSITLPFINQTIGLHAIGVQCKSSSAVGTARLDGIAGTFTDFTTDGSLPPPYESIPRFGNAVPTILLPGLRGDVFVSFSGLAADEAYKWLFPEYGSKDTLDWLNSQPNYYGIPVSSSEAENASLIGTADWKTPLIASADLPINNTGDENSTLIRYDRPLKPAELRHALEEAHKLVAASMMYNQYSSPGRAWFHPNLTAAESWRQLVSARGKQSIPPLLVLVALTLWAIVCVVLGIMYGFRRRWDSFSSVKSLYWYCVGIAKVDPDVVMRS